MNLALIAIALATTLGGIAVHVAWWRISRPTDDARALALSIGFVPLVMSVTSTLVWPLAGRPPILSLDYLVLLGALSILHGLFALVYMSGYPAAQAASPTVLIMLSAAHGRGGISRKELEDLLTDDLVCGDLVHAAIDEKFLELANGGLHIGPRGRWLLAMGRLVRRFAGLAGTVG